MDVFIVVTGKYPETSILGVFKRYRDALQMIADRNDRYPDETCHVKKCPMIEMYFPNSVQTYLTWEAYCGEGGLEIDRSYTTHEKYDEVIFQYGDIFVRISTDGYVSREQAIDLIKNRIDEFLKETFSHEKTNESS